MPDIIVKQQPATSLTVQSNSTQLLIRQAAANNITVATTGNSYVLPAATNSTLGGIIVGSNLTIANGVLSATSAGGGVTAFNNRTGNVTLTANDVSGLAFPLASNTTVLSGDTLIPNSQFYFYANFPAFYRNMYGISSNIVTSNYTQNSYVGLQTDGLTSALQEARPVVGKYKKLANGTTNQIELYFDAGVNFHTTTRLSDNTLVEKIFFFTQSGGLTFGVQNENQFSNLEIYLDRITFDSEFKQANQILNTEILRKGDADRLYQPLVRRN